MEQESHSSSEVLGAVLNAGAISLHGVAISGDGHQLLIVDMQV